MNTTLLIILLIIQLHITSISYSLYLHRSQSHRSVTFHYTVAHFMRFCLWLTTAVPIKSWVAIHRLHHAESDKPNDPHSPHTIGSLRVIGRGMFFYLKTKRHQPIIEHFGKGVPDDWIERNLYTRYPFLGIFIMLAIDLLLAGPWGFIAWLLQIAWGPIWAGFVVNVLGHLIGYRNHNLPDHSRNLTPWGMFALGEEMQNNHHKDESNPNFAHKWWEFDPGWMYIRIFKFFKLAKTRR